MNDLHLHRTASDGALPPDLLVRRAREAGLSAVALPDHDTLAGVPEGEAIGVIRGAGGVDVLCPPATLLLPEGSGRGSLPRFAAGLAALGLDATLVRVPDEEGVAEARRLRIASETGLLPSRGSGFHGTSPREPRPSGRVPDDAFEALCERCRRYRGP